MARRVNETSWEMYAGDNHYEDITATKDGLEIGFGETIPWAELDEARDFATGKKVNTETVALTIGFNKAKAHEPS